MALTITRRHGPYVIGDRREVIVDIAFDSSYATGGLALLPSAVGLAEIHFVDSGGTTAGGTTPYDYSAQKLLLFTSGSTQASNASDQSAVSVKAKITGR